MCIIADPPTLIPIFKSSDPEHAAFAAVFEWITKGRGKLVTGGTTYQKELKAVSSITPFLLELERRGKLIRAKLEAVDEAEDRAKQLYPNADFDDPHLVALANTSGCKLICIRDPRAHKFLRSSKLYKSPADRPKLYTRAKNKNILCQSNIAPCCK